MAAGCGNLEGMPLVKVAQLSQLPPDSVTEVAVGGDVYALCRVGGRVSALSGVCLHRGGPLGQGAIHEGRVLCPWHAWEWDCRTGANSFDPAQKVATFEVRVEGDDILLAIP
jgi:nitrite reductase/ring-hydroxylating ferredoxin subunit